MEEPEAGKKRGAKRERQNKGGSEGESEERGGGRIKRKA